MWWWEVDREESHRPLNSKVLMVAWSCMERGRGAWAWSMGLESSSGSRRCSRDSGGGWHC